MEKKILFGTAMAVMMLGTVVGCSASEEEKETNKKPTDVVKVESKTDKDLLEELGQAKDPIFTQITETDLDKEEKEFVDKLTHAVGVNLHGENLYIIVPKLGEEKVRHITEVHEEDNVVKVYVKKVDAKEDGSEMIIGRVANPENKKYELWFMDAETKAPLQLEDVEGENKASNDEKTEASNVETDDETAKGKPVSKKDKEEDSEKEADKEDTENN